MGILDDRNPNSQNTDNSAVEDQYAYMKRSRTSSIIVFVAIIAIYFLYQSFGTTLFGGETTTGRIKLDTANFTLLDKWFSKTSAYTDDNVTNSMITFFESTGVQPFVLLVEDEGELSAEELNARAEDYYKNELFASSPSSDEGHMVIAFQTTTGHAGIYSGTEARIVMDADAEGQLRTIISSCYNKYSGSAILEKTFRQAANKIMGRSKASIYIIIGLAIICVIYFIWNFRKTGKQYRNEQTGGNIQ